MASTCTSSRRYATRAGATLAARGVDLVLDPRACSGANATQVGEQVGASRDIDIITVTLGGNDLGFTRVLSECLLGQCRGYDQPTDRLPGMIPEAGRSDWDLLEHRVERALTTLLGSLSPTGRLFVLTYPIPFPETPDELCLATVSPIPRHSRLLLNAAAVRLNHAIASAASSAAVGADAEKIEVIEWRADLGQPERNEIDETGVRRTVLYNRNGICGGDPMLNGVVVNELNDSFHPTDRGHEAAATIVARAIETMAARR